MPQWILSEVPVVIAALDHRLISLTAPRSGNAKSIPGREFGYQNPLRRCRSGAGSAIAFIHCGLRAPLPAPILTGTQF
jgi:hypothetical protein